jgi:Plasmid pRiA4b ORF-3-like protein
VGTLRLRVRLRDVRPDVVRVVDLPGDATLDEVHLMLQVALGWTDSHLHEFEVGDVAYGQPDPDGPDVQDERRARLADLPATWVYVYDFGDGWTHDVEVLGAGGEHPGCVYGEGDCPPEDCGASFGFHELREAIVRGEVDADVVRPFDQARADQLVRQVVGRVPDSVRMLLDVVGDGITPTSAGRLPRVVVREVQARRPDWARGAKPANRERDIAPLYGLHDVLYSTGLLRMSRGRLVPLRAAGDDREVLRRLRRWFDPDTFIGVFAELAVATLLARGSHRLEALAAALAPALGPDASLGGRPLDEDDVTLALAQVGGALEGLGLITSEGWTWDAGPDAGWLLPRAALLADCWSAGGADGPAG